MPAPKEADFKERLSRTREIHITVTGRKSGRKITNPVWFVVDGENLYLVPVEGADTQWYKNILSNPSIRVAVGHEEVEFKADPVTDAAKVSSIVEKFREKYGAADVKKYYPKHNVAVLLKLH